MSGLAVVTRMAMAKRPDLQAIRPAGRVNSLVFDALCALDAPRVETVAHWAGVTVGQAGAAIDRLRALDE